MFLPTLRIRMGSFIDAGFRFRKNNFYKLDSWIPGFSNSVTTFFDVIFFNNDEYLVDEKTASNKIGEVFFRIDTNEVEHFRKVYMVADLLAEVGGLNNAITGMIMALLGSYLTFSTDINYMTYMYSKSTKSKVDDAGSEDK